MKLRFALFAVLLLTLVAAPTLAEGDGRINEVWHFGGDVLYCDKDSGCTLLNMNGQFLWNVPQDLIDEAMAEACATRHPQYIEAGFGTYGPSTLSLHCYEGMDPYLILSAYDEWGMLSDLKFGPDYAPVTAPPEHHDTVVTGPSQPDQDGDGFPDSEDECPTQGDEGYGVDEYGCPNEPPT